MANQSYNNQQITASASADPKVQAAWQNGGQTAAQAAVTAAESDWEAKGFKTQVEEAQATVHTLGSQSPQLKWESWQALCNPDTDFPTDPTDGQFGPTVFAPCDVINQPAWPNFSIAGADIPNLVSQAPPQLKNIFGTTSGSSTIDSLSFEFCKVALVRPWFSPDLFAARFWRFSDPTVQLSDGNDPSSGNLPAYITAVVLARNIVVTLRPASPASPPPPPVHAFIPLPARGLQSGSGSCNSAYASILVATGARVEFTGSGSGRSRSEIARSACHFTGFRGTSDDVGTETCRTGRRNGPCGSEAHDVESRPENASGCGHFPQ